VPPQDIITRDNVSVKVNAVVYYRVMEPIKAIIEIEDYNFATSQISQTTLRSVVGQVPLDDLLSSREKLNASLQEIIDKQTDPWGIKVSVVEIKHVDLPQEMQRAMARQAEAERERRAKVISAEGEFQAAEKLKQAAETIADHPMAMQMRYLQTLSDMSSERSSIVVLPLPLEFLKAFSGKKG
jgi:regulator of protease activity HflC (stomatin/prohibitin superfamily)